MITHVAVSAMNDVGSEGSVPKNVGKGPSIVDMDGEIVVCGGLRCHMIATGTRNSGARVKPQEASDGRLNGGVPLQHGRK